MLKLSVSLLNKSDAAPPMPPRHCIKPHTAAWKGHLLPNNAPTEPGISKASIPALAFSLRGL